MAKAYVIVGASLAGATAAVTLREEGADGAVIMIGAERELPYERPPLSKAYLRGDAPFEKALVRPSAFYAEHGIEMMLGTRVARVDTTQRVVELEDQRRIPFDTLLLATGARNRVLSTPGAELEGIYSLRTIHDADRIRAEMRPGRRAVVVGMGFIGSEVAASLRQAGVDVVTVNPGKTPLFRVLGETVGAALAALHRAHGVRTIFEDSVAAFEGERRVSRVVTKAGQRLECDFVVAGVGVEPAVDLLADSGIRIDNGVVVDEYCRDEREWRVCRRRRRESLSAPLRSPHPHRALAERHQAGRRCRAQHAWPTRPVRRGSLVLVGSDPMRTCSTPDFTPSGSN